MIPPKKNISIEFIINTLFENDYPLTYLILSIQKVKISYKKNQQYNVFNNNEKKTRHHSFVYVQTLENFIREDNEEEWREYGSMARLNLTRGGEHL